MPRPILIRSLVVLGPALAFLFAAARAAADGHLELLLGEPKLLAARPRGDLASIVARPLGGFLLAFTGPNEATLLVGEHDETAQRERLRRLGSLGYTGANTVKTLQPLDEHAYVVSWDVGHHYAGLLSSQVVMIDGNRRSQSSSRNRFFPLMVGDGTGAAIGFFSADDRTFFGRWDRDAQLQRVRPLRGTGLPLTALPFRGGALLVSLADPAFRDSLLEWFDATGRRVESVRGHCCGLATDGESLVVELSRSSDDNHILGRFGTSPAELGPRRVLATKPPRAAFLSEQAAAVGAGGVTLLAWSASSQLPDECGIRIRAFDRGGAPLTEPLCATPGAAARPRLAASADGSFFWLAWLEEQIPNVRTSQIFVRKVEMGAS